MKTSVLIAVIAAILIGSFVTIFWWAQHIAHNDQKLFEAHDRHRETMLARACSPRAALWKNTETGEYACRLVNPDGAQLLYQVDDEHLRYARN